MSVFHPDYDTVDKRSNNRDALNEIIQNKFNEFTLAELTEILIEAGVPCGPVNTLDQVFDNPQVKHLKMSRTQEHPTLGDLDLVGSAINLSNAPKPDTFKRHTPEAGEHTAEILGELGYSTDAIEELQGKKVI